jgi:hypothetical protein
MNKIGTKQPSIAKEGGMEIRLCHSSCKKKKK